MMNISYKATLLGLAALAALGLTGRPAHADPAANAPGTRLNADALHTVQTLEQEADTRTSVEQRIDSHLLYALRQNRGQAAALGAPRLPTYVKTDAAGLVEVDIDATVTPSLLAEIKAVGGQVIYALPEWQSVRARLPLGGMEAVAGWPGVKFIRPGAQMQTQGSFHGRLTPGMSRPTPPLVPLLSPAPSKAGRTPGFTRRADRVGAVLPGLLDRILGSRAFGLQAFDLPAFDGTDVAPPTGSVDSEGDTTHRAILARSTFHVDGTGIKIGVMSDSDDFVSDAQASGDLGPVTTLSGQSGSPGSGEGTAMLEIVHDLAPGASLYFATASPGDAQFAANIVALRNAGCNIIVDDVQYPDEPPFQDGIVARAVDQVTASGALYFSCATNFGNVDAGPTPVWQGNFVDSGTSISSTGAPGTGEIHDFGGGTISNIVTDPISANSGNPDQCDLFWSDQLGHSANDYNLYVFDSAGNYRDSSTNVQNGSQDPYESAQYYNGDQLVIVLHSGEVRCLYLDAFAQHASLNFYSSGRVRGHNSAVNAFCVAATPATTGSGGQPPNGPYPNPFNSANVVEPFSSDGPRHIFYNPDGSAITPGNFTATGGTFLLKPEITAADGVSTSLSASVTHGENFRPFFGTSAAAPHAAALAGLLLSYDPTLTQAQVRAILEKSTIDIMAKGIDRDSGYGILDAVLMLQNAPAHNSAPALSGVSASPTSVIGGNANAAGVVTLTGNAVSATTVALKSSNPAALSVPTSVTVAIGSATAGFTATSHTVTASTSVTITATYNGVSKTTTVTVNPAPIALSGVSVSPTSVVGGSANSAGLVTLTGKAASATTVALKSSNPAALSVPTTVTVSAGAATASFTATSHAVTTTQTVTITATYNGVSKTAVVTVTPLALSSVSASPASVVGGSANAAGVVTLTGKATQATAVALKSSNPAALSVPTGVTVAIGSATAGFTAASHTVTASTSVTITATYNGVSKTTTVTVTPATGAKVIPKSLTFSPNPGFSSGETTGTVTLSGVAPTGGAAVVISSGGSAILTATVPAGKTSTTFGLTLPTVTSSTTFVISAAYGGTTINANLVVNPTSVQPKSLSFTPNPATGGGSTTGTVTLTAAAPSGGAVVTITQNGTSLGGILVADGQSSTTFTLTLGTVTSKTVYTMGALYNGTTVTTNLTVNP